ncbi:hypothetical protein AGMMS49940_16760 [Spirochaetia bacterium]|nr:hypothetical protein AGMMS49940_16760 [Spirochaetia bacterium]
MKIPEATEGKFGGPDFPAKHPIKHPTALPAEQGIPASGKTDKGQISQTVDLPFAAFTDIALSLGLPRDKLSSSLLSFMQFFSLPLDPKLIQRLRQEVLSLNLMPGDRIRSGALAAAAAAGKGLTLSTEALEKYAAAIAGEERHGGSAGQDGGSADGDTGSTQGGSEGGQSGTGHYSEEHGQTNGEGRHGAEYAGH